MNLTQLVDGFTGIEHTLGLTPLYDDVVSLFAATDVQMTPTLIVVYNGPSAASHSSARAFRHPERCEGSRFARGRTLFFRLFRRAGSG